MPAEFDNRVKAMEVDERPTETYTDIGGLEKQIEELVEVLELLNQLDGFGSDDRITADCIIVGSK